MTNIENYYSIARRTGYEFMPVDYILCPLIEEKLKNYIQETGFTYRKSFEYISDLPAKCASEDTFRKYYNRNFKSGTYFDMYGVAHEPGSAAAFHMTKMYHPMADFDSVEQILEYPLPDYTNADPTEQIAEIKKAHDNDLIATANVQCTIWECAWYMRGMENLMADMMTDEDMAEALFDRVAEISMKRAESYVKNGVDVLFLGDDIGMQRTIMMSESLYCTWLKPRMAQIVKRAKEINPNVIIFYHSCGYVKPMIPHLIDIGIEVLDPIQPECMDFREIHDMYGDKLSFHGTIGTQSTMPRGTPEDVRREVFKNLEIAGDKGGLFVCPTHMLEPDVPLENLIAYINACRDFK